VFNYYTINQSECQRFLTNYMNDNIFSNWLILTVAIIVAIPMQLFALAYYQNVYRKLPESDAEQIEKCDVEKEL